MSTHTPGPWTWTWQEERTCYALKGSNGQVLEITKGLTPTIDDQRLIAAAPRMRELLAKLANETCDHGPMPFCPRDEARAILRDVEGEGNANV